MDPARDFAKLMARLQKQKKVEIPLRSLETEEEALIYGLLGTGLAHINQTQLLGNVQLVISELLSNAEKAILKRLIYKLNQDIEENDESLKKFFKQYKESIYYFRTEAKKGKPCMTFEARLEEGGLALSVANLGVPTERELRFIDSALDAARGGVARSLTDYAAATGEGDGFGLYMAVKALMKSGIPPEKLSYEVTRKETLFRVFIPESEVSADKLAYVEEHLIAEMDSLPAFPEQIKRMMEVCDSPKSDARQVASEIGKDMTIASEIIRLANSGGFAGGNVADILEAVKIVGLKNISGLLLKAGAFQVLEKRYGSLEEILQHSVRVGFYARTLARKYKMAPVADQAYVAGLLHDMGKVVLYHRNEDRETVKTISGRWHRRPVVDLEEVALGVGHALVGAKVGEKWNFPEELCLAIELHHRPQEATDKAKRLVYSVYMGNVFADYQEEKLHYYGVHPLALSHFNLTTQDAFDMLSANLKAEYESVQARDGGQ